MHPMLIRASVTDFVLNPIVNAATEFISSAGLPAVFILMTLESACIPIPSEAIMLFAGFAVSKGELTLFGVVAAGVLGNLCGSLIGYAIGFYGRLDLLERHKVFHISQARLAQVESWFDRYGNATVFFSRMIPLVRTFVSVPAGVAKMPLGRFSLLTTLGSIPWVLALALIGESVGSNWESWRHHLAYLDYVVLAAVILGIGWWLLRRRRDRDERGALPD
ncbi:MAG: DedA family protein [Actinobacteria bacterium]|nr:DedA family protein [Actinomycetota bacterium]